MPGNQTAIDGKTNIAQQLFQCNNVDLLNYIFLFVLNILNVLGLFMFYIHILNLYCTFFI